MGRSARSARARKRCRVVDAADATPLVPEVPSSSTFNFTKRFLPILLATRHCLHAFLTDADGARLLRAGRTSAGLVAGFRFRCVFRPHYDREVRTTLALYAQYDMRITRLQVLHDVYDALVDWNTGRSWLPASLVTLAFGNCGQTLMELASVEDASEAQGLDREREARDADCADEYAEPVDVQSHIARLFKAPGSVTWASQESLEQKVGWHVPELVPGALPHGLRHLFLNSDGRNAPLRPGSIPSSVTFLRFGRHWRFGVDVPRVLEPHVLPEGLTHVVFDGAERECNDPLLVRHSLPASLRQLRWGCGRPPLQELSADILPPHLELIDLCGVSHVAPLLHPGVLPPSVRRLRLSLYQPSFEPLPRGSIPEGVVHLLIDGYFQWELGAGTLPSTLRTLAVVPQFSRFLVPGVLPDGLRLLFLPTMMHAAPIPGSAIPDSVVGLQLPGPTARDLVYEGALPRSLRWIVEPQQAGPGFPLPKLPLGADEELAVLPTQGGVRVLTIHKRKPRPPLRRSERRKRAR